MIGLVHELGACTSEALAAASLVTGGESWFSKFLEPSNITSTLSVLVAAWAVYMAGRKSSEWANEFRYRRDHDLAKAVNRAVIEWIGGVREVRFWIRAGAEDVCLEEVRTDLERARLLAEAAQAAISDAAVTWGHDDPELNRARATITDVMGKLGVAVHFVQSDDPATKEEGSRWLYAQSSDADEIEPMLRGAHDSVERATRDFLGYRSKRR